MADDGRVTIKAILDTSGISQGVKDIDRALGSIKTSGIDGVGKAAEKSGESLEDVGKSAQSGMGQAADAAEAAASSVSSIGDAGSSLGGLSDAIASPIEEGAGQAEGSVGKLKGFFSEFVEETKASFEGLLPAITAANLAQGVIEMAQRAVGAILDLGKQSFEAYASYEQLVGGVETLFGAGGRSLEEYAERSGKTVEDAKGDYDRLMSAQNEVMANAEQAYKTAGMSQNEYMETVTSFSASLIKGLGGDTVAAAKYADMAIVDMSDNANKMGTDIGSIQMAYQGFAKNNYTMLDNLKLGYGGTQSEMAKLINDSGVLGDTMTVTAETVNDVSFDKIVEAIHVMQERMDIAGTTSKEAATTIEGSIGSMKAAWENLLIGFGDPEADMDALMDALIESVITAAGNVIPAVGRIATSLITAIPGAFVSIGTHVWEGIVGSIDAATGGAATRLIETVGGALQAIIGPIVEGLSGAVQGFIDWLQPALDALNAFLTDVVLPVAQGVCDGISEGWSTLSAAIGPILDGIKTTIEGVWNTISSVVNIVVGGIKGLVTGDFSQMEEGISGVMDGISGIIDGVWNTIKGIFEGTLGAIGDVVGSVFGGIQDAIGNAMDGAENIVSGAIDAILGIFNFNWSLPDLKLPHIVVGEYIDVPVLGRIPNPTTLRVDWYAKGAIFDTASVIGVGEAGPEAVMPLKGHRMRPFAEAVAADMGGKGDIQIEININVEHLEGTKQDIAQLADLVDKEVRRKLDRSLRNGAYA